MKIKILVSALIVGFFAALLSVPCRSAAQQAPRRIEIVAERFDYLPSEITLKKGEPVVLALTSKDVHHGLKFKELNLDIRTKKGRTREVSFTPTRTGDFVGQCSVFCGSGHGSMKLTLHVTE